MSRQLNCTEMREVLKKAGVKVTKSMTKEQLKEKIVQLDEAADWLFFLKSIRGEVDVDDDEESVRIINRGTGAGGAQTNVNGLLFEDKTDNVPRLLENGFVKENDYLVKRLPEMTVYFAKQHSFKKLIEKKYNAVVTKRPDEGYIFELASGRKVVKILEKKNQNVEGSVEEKLIAGNGIKRMYKMRLGSEFDVCYGFCLSTFYKKKFDDESNVKYADIRQTFMEDGIDVMYGDDDDYFDKLNEWMYAGL